MIAKSLTIAVAALIAGTAAAEEKNDDGWAWAMGNGITFSERPIVSAELSLAFDSKFMSYGLVDNNEPILTPGAGLTFFDWVTFSAEAIFDLTKYGQRAGYGNRALKYQEFDPGAAISHSFGPDDVSWLPTTVEFELGYSYERHPRSVDDDTQFVTFEIGLPDLWIEPVFSYERDTDRDDGTYLNIELGHTFAIIDGESEEDDPCLAFKLSVAQGWGDRRRIRAYLPDANIVDDDGEYGELDHQGLMDTCFKGELTWTICDGVELAGYVAYYDYLFDPATRRNSKIYEATGDWDKSWNFVGGISATVTF